MGHSVQVLTDSSAMEREISSVAESDEAILRAYLPRIFGYLLLRVRNDTALAEDLTQETFLAWVKASASGTRIENQVGWLFATARNRLVSHYRHSELAVDLELVDEADLTNSPDAFSLAVDRVDLVAALDTLPDIQRLVLLWRHADGLSVREIATLVGKSEHSIEAHLKRARQSMRVALPRNEEGGR